MAKNETKETNVERTVEKLFYGAMKSKNGTKVIDAVQYFDGDKIVVSITNKKPSDKGTAPQAFSYLKITDLRMLYRDVLFARISNKVYPVGNKGKEKSVFYSVGGGFSGKLGKIQSRIMSIKCDYTRNYPFTLRIQNGVGVKVDNSDGLIAMAHLMTDCEFYMSEDQFLEFCENSFQAYDRFLVVRDLLKQLNSSVQTDSKEREEDVQEESGEIIENEDLVIEDPIPNTESKSSDPLENDFSNLKLDM